MIATSKALLVVVTATIEAELCLKSGTSSVERELKLRTGAVELGQESSETSKSESLEAVATRLDTPFMRY